MPDVGEVATLTLAVDPHDNTTAASATVTSPTGVVSTLTPTTTDGGATWTAYLPLATAGQWQVLWTVTGTGQGVEPDSVYAFGPVMGRTYATLSDLAAYLGTDPDPGSDRLLVRATRLVDMMLVGSWYAVDDNGMPTDPDQIAALRDATCAQVEWFDETGDVTGASGRYQAVSVGNVSISGSMTGTGQRYAPDAANILRLAGLSPVWAQVYG